MVIHKPFIATSNLFNSFLIYNEIRNRVVALIPWGFFSTTLIQSTTAIVCNAGIVKKVYFPREILPISVVTSNLLNFLISCIIIIAALIISGVGLSWYILFLPLILIVQYILLIGLSFILSAITVYIRDLEYFINVLIMLWFYLNPIVYSIDFIPAKWLPIFELNPMLHIINAYRDVLFYQKLPDMFNLGLWFIISVIIAFFGYKIFKKSERRFAEEL